VWRTRRPERASSLVESDGVEARRRIHGDRGDTRASSKISRPHRVVVLLVVLLAAVASAACRA